MINSFLNVSADCIFMNGAEKEEESKDTDYKGMYHAIDMEEWEDPFPILKIGNKGRVHLHQDYIDSDLWVFVSESDEIFALIGELSKVGPARNVIKKHCNTILLPKRGPSKWDEVFQSRGKNAGEPLNVFPNGDICVKYKKG
jgi:hypothetical protein